MLDALKHYIVKAERKSRILEKFDLIPKEYFLLTLHRPYNVDNPEVLKEIIGAFLNIKSKTIFPVHPRTRKMMENFQILTNNQIIPIEPVGYLDFLLLEKHAKKIITDSGGIQKEAFFHGVPCITLRSETEWEETLIDRWNVLVKDRNKDSIINAVHSKQGVNKIYNLFGDGKAAEKIVNISCSKHENNISK